MRECIGHTGIELTGLTTQRKLCIARFLYRGLRLVGFREQAIVRRRGVRFNLDLREGIELSLFLFRGFQRHVAPGRFFQLRRDAVIFDIGANVGSVCLPLAASLPESIVYAFEPTDYAFERLRLNVALNPQLLDRIHLVQAFVSTAANEKSELIAFSSWRVDKPLRQSLTELESQHAVHKGIQKPATKTQISLDDFVRSESIERVDFVKIDTDGHELKVLQGASQTLRCFRPIVVFELTKYLLQERGSRFEDYEAVLLPIGYRLIDSRRGQQVDYRSLDRLIPHNGSIDVLALPGR